MFRLSTSPRILAGIAILLCTASVTVAQQRRVYISPTNAGSTIPIAPLAPRQYRLTPRRRVMISQTPPRVVIRQTTAEDLIELRTQQLMNGAVYNPDMPSRMRLVQRDLYQMQAEREITGRSPSLRRLGSDFISVGSDVLESSGSSGVVGPLTEP